MIKRLKFPDSNEGHASKPAMSDMCTAEPVPIISAVDGPAISSWLGDADWSAWRVFLSALMGEPMSEDQLALFQRCTGRKEAPRAPFHEAWIIAGRRARKSAIAALLGIYFAVYRKWPKADGESVRVLIVAVSKDQAAIVRGYCQAILESHPALERLIASRDQYSIKLTNGIEICVATNSFRSIRGPTTVCAILEECAFWFSDDSANPDREVLRAIKPSMLTVPGALILGISSPYARKGLLWEKYERHFGKDESKVLVWQASTEVMNPHVDKNAIAEAYEEDPIAAAAEYGAQFRSDIEAFLSREAIANVIEKGKKERSPQDAKRYFAFVDPAGGSGKDAMTLAIAHEEEGIVILDCLREIKPPFSPASAVDDFVKTLKSYRCREVTGDRFASQWCREPFRYKGIIYRLCDKPKGTLYGDLLPVINSGKCKLLDNEALINQLV